jgi:hypothetical protein
LSLNQLPGKRVGQSGHRRQTHKPPSRHRVLRGEVHVDRLLNLAFGDVLDGVVLVDALERAVPDDLRLVIAFAV